MLCIVNKIVDKILQENETKKEPLEGNALLDFTMDEIYFRKKAIIEIYKPLYLQFKDESRNLDSKLRKFEELERRQNALLNSFPNLQNYGNFQTQFDFSIDIEDN